MPRNRDQRGETCEWPKLLPDQVVEDHRHLGGLGAAGIAVGGDVATRARENTDTKRLFVNIDMDVDRPRWIVGIESPAHNPHWAVSAPSRFEVTDRNVCI